MARFFCLLSIARAACQLVSRRKRTQKGRLHPHRARFPSPSAPPPTPRSNAGTCPCQLRPTLRGCCLNHLLQHYFPCPAIGAHNLSSRPPSEDSFHRTDVANCNDGTRSRYAWRSKEKWTLTFSDSSSREDTRNPARLLPTRRVTRSRALNVVALRTLAPDKQIVGNDDRLRRGATLRCKQKQRGRVQSAAQRTRTASSYPSRRVETLEPSRVDVRTS